MKIAISNIAWERDSDDEVGKLLSDIGIKAIEIAPTKINQNISNITSHEIKEYASFWKQYNVSIVAMQSILFGKPDLLVFDSNAVRQKTVSYIEKIIDLAAEFEIESIVFGSPKNRFVPSSLTKDQIDYIALEFFSHIAEYAKKYNINFCIEPNPVDYGANFVTNTEEAIQLITNVHNNNFCLHLDSGIFQMNNENPEIAITKGIPYMKHFHISEPFLAKIDSTNENHALIANTLKKANYSGYVSVEMRSLDSPLANLKNISDSLISVTSIYS